MVNNSKKTSRDNWVEASGLPYLFRALGMAVHPSKINLALIGIVLTVALGWTLDMVWIGGGVDGSSIERFVSARHAGEVYEDTAGDMGIFQAWRDYERRCLLSFLDASIPPNASFAVAWDNLCNMFRGLWWLAVQHSIFFALFAGGSLLIWSYCGGAICRIAAVQFASDEKPAFAESLSFARRRLFGGFYLAPCIPLAFIIIAMVCLALGGMLLRIPVLGDIVGGLGFILALVSGFVITLIMIGMIVGGSLFWPAVAAEGSDAFDAFSRGLAYPLSKPFKALLYSVITIVYASFCWLAVNIFISLTLTITRTIVGFGTSPFGWWNRGVDGVTSNKLELLWPSIGPNTMVNWADWSQLSWYESFSAFMIGSQVLLVVCLMWAFLVSFYFSGSTIIYFLLRNDVDGIDLQELYTEEFSDEGFLADSTEPTEPSDSPPAYTQMGSTAELPSTSLDIIAPSTPEIKEEKTMEPDTSGGMSATDESSTPTSFTQDYKNLSSDLDDDTDENTNT